MAGPGEFFPAYKLGIGIREAWKKPNVIGKISTKPGGRSSLCRSLSYPSRILAIVGDIGAIQVLSLMIYVTVCHPLRVSMRTMTVTIGFKIAARGDLQTFAPRGAQHMRTISGLLTACI